MSSWADGDLCGTVDFDYDAVDRRLGFVEPGEAPRRIIQAENFIRPLQETLDWVLQKVPKNQNGIEIRAVIAGWIYLPHLRELTLTEVAAMVGRDKQSLGRWVDDFKQEFPNVRICHMRFRG